MSHSFRSLAFAAGLMLAAVPAFAQTLTVLPDPETPDWTAVLGLTWSGDAKVVEPLLAPSEGSLILEQGGSQKEPAVGLVTMPGARGCLIRLNEVCVIAGHKLTVE